MARNAAARAQAASGPGAFAGASAARGESDSLRGADLPVLRPGNVVIGYDESEQLDVEPARYCVRVTKREKRACRGCEQGTVTMAPLEPRIVEKGLASDAVVIDTVVAKYCDHLPLYRQAAILEREAGVEIGRATLDGWVMRVGELLVPVVQAMRKDLLTVTIYRRTRPLFRCRCTTGAAAITKRIYGSTASRAVRRCSTSAWGAGARVREVLGQVGGHTADRRLPGL